MNRTLFNLRLNFKTIIEAFGLLPIRIVRILLHFLQWMPRVRKYHLQSNGLTEWSIDLAFYIMDVFFIPDMVELVSVWMYPQIRLLDLEEKKYAQEYFGNRLHLSNIRMNDKIAQRFKKLALAFVSFNTIHFSERISWPVFIHELVHIWQYQKFGSVYIYRALKAQVTAEGYDYGGLENLYARMLNREVFVNFNFEQQGQIFEDYCAFKESEDDQNAIAEATFLYYIGQVKDGRLA